MFLQRTWPCHQNLSFTSAFPPNTPASKLTLFPLLCTLWSSCFLALPGQENGAVTSMVSLHEYFCSIKLRAQEGLYYVFYYCEAVALRKTCCLAGGQSMWWDRLSSASGELCQTACRAIDLECFSFTRVAPNNVFLTFFL